MAEIATRGVTAGFCGKQQREKNPVRKEETRPRSMSLLSEKTCPNNGGNLIRPVQIWVPDTRTEGFASECRRQARLAARSAQEKPTLGFISEIADWHSA